MPPSPLPSRTRTDDLTSADPVNAWLLAHLRSGLWLLGVLAVAGVALVAAMTRLARTAEEAALATPAWTALLTGGTAPAAGVPSPLATLQIGAYTHLTGAVVRWDSAVFAAREAMVFFTLLSVILLWVIARRIGLSAPAAVAATLVFALAPVAVQTHSLVSVDTVALPWALLALLLALSSRRQIAGFVVAGLALAVAMLTSVAFVAMLPLVVWLMIRSTHAGRRVWPLVTGGLMLAAGVAASVLPVILSGEYVLTTIVSTPMETLDPGLAVVAVVAAMTGVFFTWMRAWSVFVLAACAAILALEVTGNQIPAALVAITIPIAAIVVAGVVDIAVAHIRSTAARPAAVGALAVVSAGVLVTVPAWALLVTDVVTEARPDPTVAAQEWIIDNVDRSQRVVVDDVMRADLLSAGWRETDVDGYRAASGDLPTDWLDADVVVTRERTDLLGDSVVVARFGDPSNAIEIRRVTDEDLTARTSAAVAAAADRQRAGVELAQNPRLLLTEPARAALTEGRVDERIILVLGALAADADVAVEGFPVIAGEEGRTLRQVSLSRLQAEPLARDDRPTALGTRLLDALRSPFAPDASDAAEDTLTLRYPIDPDPLVP